MLEEKEKNNEKILDKTIDFLFKKESRYILLLFALALILRIIAAHNLGGNPDDIGHGVFAINALESHKLANWSQSNIVWYCIVDIFYHLLGFGQMGARFASALFGSLTVIIIFFFVKRFFKSQRVAYLSAALIAISPMLIKQTLPEMDVAVGFFLIFSAYYLFSFFEEKSMKNIAFCAIFLAIGTMIKLYVAFIAFSFFILILFNMRKNMRGNWRKILIFLIICFLSITPAIVNNYLLYKDKGFMDFVFTTALNIGRDKAAQFYSGFAGWNPPYSDYRGFFFGKQMQFGGENAEGINRLPGFVVILNSLFRCDAVLILIGIIGLARVFNKNKNYFWFVIISVLPAFIYLGARIPMMKHFIWIGVLLAPCAAYLIDLMLTKARIPIKCFIAILLIFNLIYLGTLYSGMSQFYSESAIGKIIDYRTNIPNDALVVVDSRIYRGTINWEFYGKNYLESGLLQQAIQESSKTGNQAAVTTYFVECVIDDCGWGTIKDQPDFNKSTEEIVSWFANNSIMEKEIFEVDRQKDYLPFLSKKKETPIYRVYKTNLIINPAILQLAKSTHSWFLYPIGYDRSMGPIFDDYNVSGLLDNSLYDLAWAVTYLAIFLAFFSVIWVFYILIGE